MRLRNGNKTNLITFYQDNRDEFKEITNMWKDTNGDLLVTYNRDKEKEALITLIRFKEIINKHFPEESVKKLKRREEESQEEKTRIIMH